MSTLQSMPQTRLKNLTVQKWLTKDYQELIQVLKGSEDPTTRLFGESSLPALLQSGQGYVGEAGDIKVCLGLTLQPETGTKTVSVICVGEEGKLTTRMESKDPEATLLFQAFVTDFPQALITTDEGKPLCLFKGRAKDRVFIGYLNLQEFREVTKRKYKDLTVGVP